LIDKRTDKILSYIQLTNIKFPNFLKHDIEKDFPTTNHEILLKNLPKIIKMTTDKPLSCQTKKYLKQDIPSFFKQKLKRYQGLFRQNN
jgi:hypothetical protein